MLQDKTQFTDDVDITGNLDVSGDVTLVVILHLVIVPNDSIEFVAGIYSDLIPSTHNTYSIRYKH